MGHSNLNGHQQSDEEEARRASTNIAPLQALSAGGALAAAFVAIFLVLMATSGVAVLGEPAEHDRFVMEHVIEPRLRVAAGCGLVAACLAWIVVGRIARAQRSDG